MTLSIQPTTVVSVEQFLQLPETKPASEYFNVRGACRRHYRQERQGRKEKKEMLN
ncbi:MAG: hypothetical protein V7K38_24010 [Nostoc sp.]|uniref:hypothetical protein n=1 Tax=Nostoc sp. TaxID=1180 RepID=UPI002FF5A9C7